jgi:PPK2 family polyphosphate:nucleotide phosphotransferase
MEKYLVQPGNKFKLAKIATDDVGKFTSATGRAECEAKTAELKTRLTTLQEKLFASSSSSLLIVLQAMDGSGKDSATKSLFAGCSPNGVRVSYFKAPTALELSHDYLWRVHQQCPPRGIVGIFNRSHYEDVLITRVHGFVSEKVVRERFAQIRHFEQMLSESGTVILKFHLRISKAEQAVQLQERVDDPTKRWKFNPGDLEERKLWDKYMSAYQDALTATSTDAAPWYVIPSDQRWYRNYVMTKIILNALEDMKLEYPAGNPDVDWANLKVV